jgi:hypothetical protein
VPVEVRLIREDGQVFGEGQTVPNRGYSLLSWRVPEDHARVTVVRAEAEVVIGGKTMVVDLPIRRWVVRPGASIHLKTPPQGSWVGWERTSPPTVCI